MEKTTATDGRLQLSVPREAGEGTLERRTKEVAPDEFVEELRKLEARR